MKNTADFYSRCFKSSVKMFSQVLCYCMCKQTKFEDPSISCGTSPSLLLKQLSTQSSRAGGSDPPTNLYGSLSAD